MIKTIIFRIGRRGSEQNYTVHKSFATKSSLVIQGILNDREKAQPNCNDPVRISKARPAEFGVYVYWLYADEISTTDAKGDNSYGTTLVRLYILGKYLEDEEFTDAVFGIISEVSEDKSMVFETTAVKLAWSNLPRDDPLRAKLCQTMLAKSVGKPDRAKVRYSLDYTRGLDPGDIMAALEHRQYTGFIFGEDTSEVGEALTALLGPAHEEF